MEIHCLESNDCDGGVTKDTHRINSQELALLKYLFSKTACAAFADAQKPENEQVNKKWIVLFFARAGKILKTRIVGGVGWKGVIS